MHLSLTGRMWAIEEFCNTVWSHLFLWPTGCEWHCTFCEMLSHSYDQQGVSELHILWKAVSSHLFPWPTGCKWWHFVKRSHLITSSFPTNSLWVTCTFCKRQSHHILSHDQQFVSDILLQILWKAVSSHLFLWPTASKQHSMHMWLKAVSSHLFLWPTGCEWHCTFSERQSYPMTNSLWVTLHILSKAVSSLFFLWTTASEQDCKFSNLHFPMFVYQKVSMLPYLFHVFIIIIDCKISFMSFIPLSLISCHRWVILVHWVLIFKSVFMTVPCRSDWQFDIHWMFYSIS